MGGKIYSRTSAGRTALFFDRTLEMDYRLLLAVLETERAGPQVASLLPSYPEPLLQQRLGELDAMGLVEVRLAPAATGAA